MTTTTVTSKGQIVIPAAIRRHLNIKKGVRLSVYEQDNRIILQPMTRAYFDSMAGMAGKGGDLVGLLLKERAREKRREDAKFK
jgi:AbrB family looped-hinge helix DNA binding protein